MNTSRAKEILDTLDIEYNDVRRGTFLYVIMKDGSHIPFTRLLREHKKHKEQEVTDLLFTPHQQQTQIDNEVTRAETEIITKKSKKKHK